MGIHCGEDWPADFNLMPHVTAVSLFHSRCQIAHPFQSRTLRLGQKRERCAWSGIIERYSSMFSMPRQGLIALEDKITNLVATRRFERGKFAIDIDLFALYQRSITSRRRCR
jgi:hypothetical protein